MTRTDLLLATLGAMALAPGASPLPATAAARLSPPRSDPARCDRAHPLRVLFIGNSFTYVNNVPALVRGIASSLSGPCIETAMIASGGATLEDQWRGDSAAARIREGHWTHVLLNDQSTFGEGWWLEGTQRVGTSGRELAEFGGRFVRVIREAGATPVLLAHWANADAPARDQQALDHLFATVARETGSAVAPVGGAIKRAQSEIPRLPVYFTDQHHLGPAGGYLEALIIYSTLTGRSSAGAAGRITGPAVEFNRGVVSDSVVRLVDLPTRDAAELQRVAESSQKESARLGAIPGPAPLSAEFPAVPAEGDPVDRRGLLGSWAGKSRVLPNPADDSVRIAFSIGDETDQTRPDSIHLRAGMLHFAGPATFAIEGARIIVRSSVMPVEGRRSRAQPLVVELQGVLTRGVMSGVATITQRFRDSMSSFDAIGRFEARRGSPPTPP